MAQKLIKLNDKELDIFIDLKYATEDNFTGNKIYCRHDCYLNEIAFEHLTISIEIAKKLGFKLKVFDGFRPKESQEKLWNYLPNPNFIAQPKRGSPHSRGVAIDLTLLDKNNIELDMGTSFDEFSSLSYHGSKYISKIATRNRLLLLGIMTTSGWDFFRNEWWHYQLFNSKNYPLLGDEDLKTPLTIK